MPETSSLHRRHRPYRARPDAVRRRRHKSGGRSEQRDRQFDADIRREAVALGLTRNEYVRLLVAMSKALRQGLLQDRKVNAKSFLTLAESPLFAALLRYVAASTSIALDGTEPALPIGDGASSTTEPPASALGTPPSPTHPAQLDPPGAIHRSPAPPGDGWYWDAW